MDYKHYYASNYYGLSGKAKMQAEIMKYGPISCGIEVTDKFEDYKGGIYAEKNSFPMINHIISVVGWGHDEASGQDFWIGRNSWGTYWGESGFFRMIMGRDGLGIETDCSAGIPTFTKPSEDEIIIQ